MKIVIFSKTPLAAAPWELYKALKKYTLHEVTLINMMHCYADGRSFPHHLLMSPNNGIAVQTLKSSRVWHVHNYLVKELSNLRKDHKVLAQFHSLPRMGNWKDLMAFADKCYTIKQPLQEKEYKLPGLPNIMDPDEHIPVRKQPKVRIAFAPSTRAPVGHPASKGYSRVKRILDEVAGKRDVDIEWIEGKPYLENLKLKQRSHILIDDVVTGNWHRTALEGACFGCVVLSSFKCEHFFHSTLSTLEHDLIQLIDIPLLRKEYQERSRLWVLQKWHAMDKVKAYIMAYGNVLNA